MTLENFLPPKGLLGWIALVIMGVMWFAMTVSILCLMEVGVVYFRTTETHLIT